MIKKSIAALAGIFLVGVGVAFNAMASLGNDSVGIFYDGMRSMLGLSQVQLGLASNIVNLSIVVLLFFIGRKYVNIGTFIYLVPYGFFVDLGTKIYLMIFKEQIFLLQVVAVIIGCFFIFFGVAIYIAMDIGVDPMTGLALWLGDVLKMEYKKAKIIFDLTLTVAGFLMGGKLGVVTIVASLIAGPIIQKFKEWILILTTEKIRVFE